MIFKGSDLHKYVYSNTFCINIFMVNIFFSEFNMIHLFIPLMVLGAVISVVLLMICGLIGWLDDVTDRCCKNLKLEKIFDVGILMCKFWFNKIGGRYNIAFFIAVTAATCYTSSVYMAIHDDIDCLQGVVAGWFLSIIAVAVAYDWNNPPSVITSKVVISLGIACLIVGTITLYWKYYHCLLVMGLVGAYTTLVGVFLYMMNHLKATEEEDFDEDY